MSIDGFLNESDLKTPEGLRALAQRHRAVATEELMKAEIIDAKAAELERRMERKLNRRNVAHDAAFGRSPR